MFNWKIKRNVVQKHMYVFNKLKKIYHIITQLN